MIHTLRTSVHWGVPGLLKSEVFCTKPTLKTTAFVVLIVLINTSFENDVNIFRFQFNQQKDPHKVWSLVCYAA